MAVTPNIIPTSPATSPQLTGIVTTNPMPGPLSAAAPSGAPTGYTPASSMIVGGDTNTSPFSVQLGTATANTNANTGVSGGGVGTPAPGAQPAAPNPIATIGEEPAPVVAAAPTIVTAASPTPAVSAVTAATADMAPGGTGAAVAVSGFGAAERSKPMKASVDGARFSFPSFTASNKTNKAPAITWGPGWKRVEKNGMFYMQHANGTKAVPAVEYRINSTPAGKLENVKVANGWGKKYPDGSIVVFDRTEGPYRLDPAGKKHKLALGTHTIGGIKTRIFEASVVRTLEKDGTVTVFDSRGNNRAGSNRGTIADAIAGAGAGADMVSKGAPTKGGGASTTTDLPGNIDKLTAVARGILDQVRSGNLDPAALASLQAQLSALPAGIVQAAAAAGATSPSPAASTTTTVPGTTTAGGGAAPVAGVDANASTKDLAAGTKAKLATPVAAELVGKQARFGQLPAVVQASVAAAYGSSQGAKAFKADTLVSFPAAGEVALVAKETVNLRHVKKVLGAGPGEDLALSMRPGRQPGIAQAKASAKVATASSVPSTPVTNPAGSAAASNAATGAAAVGGGPATTKRIELFPAGGEVQEMALGGLDGTYTWGTLPALARDAIMVHIKANPTSAAGKAYAGRDGAGWAMAQDAQVVIGSGFATFTNGLALVKRANEPAATPSTNGGGPAVPPSAASTHPVGHDATKPPTGAGSGVGTTAPSTPPPLPDAHAHAH